MLTIKRNKQYLNRGVIYGALVLVLGIYPFRAFADDIPTTTDQSTQTTQTTTPTTTDSSTTSTTTPTTDTTTATAPTTTTSAPTTTDSTQQTAPTTTVEQPKNYYYDSTTQRWNTDKWTYDPISGTYKAAVVAPTAPTVPDSTGTTVLDAQTKTEVSNALDSLAKTGNASVSANTLGGSATSGDALASATIINNVNSTLSNANNKEAATFVSDVMGDVNGDIILQPMLLKAMLEAGAATPTNQTVNSSTSTGITNDLQLSAQSGNATVERNTEAGSATSGSAHTVADVINIVNSMIGANQSFMGTINIYGNLNGDILVAPDFLPTLLASNDSNAQSPNPSVQVVNAKDTQSIVNNVALAAQTGQAVVTENTQAGASTSGNAMTNVVLFNLSGHEIVANNSLLVFINVLGKWVGVIVDAPSGATAAAIGNGVTKNTTTAPSLAINAVNTTAITNNLNLNSASGDARVASNTSAGNATSGDATASASIANISNSQIGLAGWFGVLFINVFGTWIGSFGVDTSAGDPIVTRTPAGSQPTHGSRPNTVIAFVPRHANAIQPEVYTTIVTPDNVQTQSQHEAEQQVKAAQIFNPDSIDTQPLMPTHSLNLPLAVGSLVITLTSLYLIRRYML